MLESHDWWEVISAYNIAVYPLQIMSIIGIIVVLLYLIYGNNSRANIVAKIFFGVSYIWIGIVFFILSKGFPVPAKYIQGGAFIFIGLLFFKDISSNKIKLVFPVSGVKRTLSIIFLLLIGLYPVIGIIAGRASSYLIYPGTLPCATTAFVLVLLSVSLPNIDKLIYILLLFWAIPFPPFIQLPKYHVYEDSIMFIIGVYSLFVWISSAFSKKNLI